MFSHNIPADNDKRTSALHQTSPSSPLLGAALTAAGAGLLLLLGISLQTGEFAYGSLLRENSWFISVTLQSLWNMLSMLLGSLAPSEVLRVGPVLLVVAGCGILFVLIRRDRVRAVRDSHRREESRG